MTPLKAKESGMDKVRGKLEEIKREATGRRVGQVETIARLVSEALALMEGEPSVRIFTWEDLEKANTAVIRAMNREPDLRSSLVGQLQISMEAMGLRVVISPPLECVEAYKRDAGIPTENGEDDGRST